MSETIGTPHMIVDIIRCGDTVKEHAASGEFVSALAKYLKEDEQFTARKEERFQHSIVVEVLDSEWRTYCKYIFEQGLSSRSVFFYHMRNISPGLLNMLSVEYKTVENAIDEKWPIPESLTIEDDYPSELLLPASVATENLSVPLDIVVQVEKPTVTQAPPIVTPPKKAEVRPPLRKKDDGKQMSMF